MSSVSPRPAARSAEEGKGPEEAKARVEVLTARIRDTEAQLEHATSAGDQAEIARLRGLLSADKRSLTWWAARTRA